MARTADNAAVGYSQIHRVDIMPLPAWVDILPVYGAIATIAGISLKTGRLLQKIDYIANDVAEIKKDIKEIKAELKEHDKRLTVLEAKIFPGK